MPWETPRTHVEGDMAFAALPLGETLLIVTAHGREAPSDDSWARYVAFGREASARVSREAHRLPGLTFSDGGAPNARQRAAVMALGDEGGALPPTAVISEAAMIRGVVTAFSWFGAPMKAFRPAEREVALGYLGLDGLARARASGLCRRLAREFPHAHALGAAFGG